MNMPVRRNTIAFLTARCATLEMDLVESRNECAQLRQLNSDWGLQARMDAAKITRLKAMLRGQLPINHDGISPARALMLKSKEYALRHGVSTRCVDGEIQAFDSDTKSWSVVEAE